MNMKKMHRKIAILTVALTIGINSILMPTTAIASEEYRIEFFNQLADKINSLYYKETVVGLDIMNEIYGNKDILYNIKSELDNNPDTKSYLESEGFTFEKISEIIGFIDEFFPNVNELLENYEDTNFLGKLIKNIFIDKSKSIDYIEYDDGIKDMGEELYSIMPDKFKQRLDSYSDDEESRINAMIKIMVEFIYSGHGTAIYDKDTDELIDLELKVKDGFIENVNEFIHIGLNEKDKDGINTILKGIEKTIKQEELERVYSDISGVIDLVDTEVYENKRIAKVVNHIMNAEDDINRAEVLKLLLDFYNIELIDYDGEFTDVSKEDYYAKYIATAKNIGIISGYEDNTLRPNSNITRVEFTMILSKVLDGNVEEPTEEQIEDIIGKFKDRDEIGYWAEASIAKLFITGIMVGKSQDEYKPNDNITFGEIDIIIDRLNHIK